MNINIPGIASIEAHASGSPLSLIAAERRRQVEELGYTEEKDDRHTGDELSEAAAAWALPEEWARYVGGFAVTRENVWPASFSGGPDGTSTSRIRELAKAGALIVAEIERIQRKGAK